MYIGSKKKSKEDITLLHSGAKNLATKDME